MTKPKFSRATLFVAVALSFLALACSELATAADKLQFEVSFPASAHAQPITGRVFVVISKDARREPRLEAGSWGDTAPIFGVDVSQLRPGEAAVIDSATLGYPPASLKEIPAGDYHVQALLNVYTEFHRSDGHTIWAHMDQWEGQQFNRSPGNLYSEAADVHLDPAAGYDVKLTLTKVIPPIEVPPDTEWVKRMKIQSPLLTQILGPPVLSRRHGACCQRDMARIPRRTTRCSTFRTISAPPGRFLLSIPARPPERQGGRYQRATDFSNAWTNSDHFPRLIAIRFPASHALSSTTLTP